MLKRLLSGLVTKPIVLATSLLKSSTNSQPGSMQHQKSQNVYFKSKILILMALIFIGSNLLLNSMIFNVSNYSSFIESSKNLDLYLSLQQSFFQSKNFLRQFKLTNSNHMTNVFINDHITANPFSQNYSSTAFLNHFIKIYDNEPNPDQYFADNPVQFHWADWVDTSPANPFINSQKEILADFDNDKDRLYGYLKELCYNKLYDARDPWIDEETYEQKLQVFQHLQNIGICSAIFKYYYWTIPEHLVFETDFKYFDIPVAEERRSEPYGIDGLASVYYDKSQVSDHEMQNFERVALRDRELLVNKLQAVYDQKGYDHEELSLKPRLDQDPADFKQPNIDEIIKEYESIETPTAADRKYLDFLRYSKAEVGNANKFYFTFPNIQIDRSAELHHYNFPWIKQIISHEERIKVIHHLIRSWFKFAQHAGIISWFNYGNLIGWYFNAQNLPWDNDVDVQISIKDCDKIGKHYNNTLVIENPKVGDASFWLQTNPFYLQQNDNQFIDARYIDTKTGIYIDISALWETDRRRPSGIKPSKGEIAFHCKHFNWFVFSDIFPLRRTLYEGAQGYMPNGIEAILKRFYGMKAMKEFNIYDHNWQKDIGLWVSNEICEMEQVPKTEDRFDENGELTLYGACNNTEILEQWRLTRTLYDTHKKEFELIKQDKEYAYLSEEDLPVFRFFNFSQYM